MILSTYTDLLEALVGNEHWTTPCIISIKNRTMMGAILLEAMKVLKLQQMFTFG